MANYQNRESFIPYHRKELIELCLMDSDFSEAKKQQFRDFCEILTAYYHFKFHRLSEKLKANFRFFNDDSQSFSSPINNSELIHQNKIELLQHFRELLEQANYTEVTQNNLEKAFQKKTLLHFRYSCRF